MQIIPPSGNPLLDNILRTWHQRAVRDAKRSLKIKKTNGGRIPRKRKKYVSTRERQNYVNLLNTTTYHLAYERDVRQDGARGLAGQAAAYAIQQERQSTYTPIDH